jgi:serine protease inhibitor ecotin
MVDPRMPKAERFVKLGGASYLIRYNSRLPVVVEGQWGLTLLPLLTIFL